jgi:hypothetical protein
MDRKGKERILKSEEDESTLHIHIWSSIMKPSKHCLKAGEDGGREWRYTGGSRLFRVHCMCEWNYHKKSNVC